MARAFEYDDGTLPLTGAAGERFADPTSADSVARAERDSTAYTLPAGDPFGDALAEQFAEPARIEPVPVPKAAAAPPPQEAPPPRRTAPPRRQEPRREQRPPSRPAPPPQRQQPQRQQSQRQQPQRQQQPPRAPVLKQSKPAPVSRLTVDELTKRPPLRKQLPPTRTKPRQARGSTMARFPANGGRSAPHPAESAAPARRAKNVRPIWPIIIFIVILVALVRGCVDSTHDNGSLAPTTSVVTQVGTR